MEYRVNIDVANQTKAGLSNVLDGRDPRVLNKVGAFASLFAFDTTGYRQPVLVMKTEEPGSKQVLAVANDRVEAVCEDMINHLINDCIVMGAEPLAIQDLIVCGKIEENIVRRIVSGCASAASAQGCVLTGGETSEQPDIIAPGTYILGSSIIGVVERDEIIDGSKIGVGDVVIALGSSGAHTNGYTLIRDLLKKNTGLADKLVGNETFLDLALVPHRCYYQALKPHFASGRIHGMAHITGGGIRENLDRVLPANVDALINLENYRPPAIFGMIRDIGKVSEEVMLRTFNLGVGMAVVCAADDAAALCAEFIGSGEDAYVIGEIIPGAKKVQCQGSVHYGM
ncbi:MAG: phosphoribosylformylglycinamidine cyclo-ligase [Gammaproteobacteria bacterium]|nr:phosphoribosylformylglycinamidine cyclo-ligase [Gammaproteobacteria bacterium]